jgi:hypothetical protein
MYNSPNLHLYRSHLRPRSCLLLSPLLLQSPLFRTAIIPRIPLHLRQLLVLHPQVPEIPRAPQLRRTKHGMQHGRQDPERQRPAIPRPAPEIHDDDGFDNRAAEGDEHGGEEDFAQEGMGSGVHAVEDDCDVRPEFSEDVEDTLGMVSVWMA